MMPEMLREFSDYRMLIYAVLLIAMMLATNTPASKAFFNNLRGIFRRKDLQETMEAGRAGGKGGNRT